MQFLPKTVADLLHGLLGLLEAQLGLLVELVREVRLLLRALRRKLLVREAPLRPRELALELRVPPRREQKSQARRAQITEMLPSPHPQTVAIGNFNPYEN